MSNGRLFTAAAAASFAMAVFLSLNAIAKVNINSGEPNESGATNPAVSPATSGIPGSIPSAQAKQHMGESNTVCGVVAGGRYMDSSKTKPTLLNFDRPFPEHTFSVMIPDADRAKFKGAPEIMFKGKTLCVTGKIIDFRGRPEIIVKDPSQITVAPETQAADTNSVPSSPTPAKAP
ncbi:MAG TPA: hypothetical protein VL171_10240 [Verrucomicrobiae bacterium]|nr:hypothetical protein [Verrucomicrobiae bacterium]